MSEKAKLPKDSELDKAKGWIYDCFGIEKGRAMAVKFSRMLASEQTPFQEIKIFETPAFGRLMTIDGVIQLTQLDEFSYHEMSSHPAINTKPTVEKVLIVGGGDGGVAREVLKYSGIKEVHLCDIDKKVTELSKEFFPEIAVAFKDKRLKVFHEDGFKFLDSHKSEYDIIITDSTDPVGFAECLFREDYFRKIHASLKADGIMVGQLESLFYNPDIIGETIRQMRKVFPIVGYISTSVPTYPSGMIGFGIASKKYVPLKDYNPKKASLPTKYYNPEIHKACFALPEFAKKFI